MTFYEIVLSLETATAVRDNNGNTRSTLLRERHVVVLLGTCKLLPCFKEILQISLTFCVSVLETFVFRSSMNLWAIFLFLKRNLSLLEKIADQAHNLLNTETRIQRFLC